MAWFRRERVILVAAAVTGALGGAPVRAASLTPAPVLGARAAILMDARTGAILYEKHAFLQMDPASLTKMMTALIVIRHGHLDQRVPISRGADQTPGSSLHVRMGEEYTRLDLLKGLLLRSGNDAAVALAESDAGSVQRFVAWMNVTAQSLGAFNTSFENPHGLTRPGHYSSAYDLALIARAALQHPLFREIVRSNEATITEQRSLTRRTIHTTNQLLYGFPGADGVKTGTTSAAGKCLVASATRHQWQLIAVVLNSPDRWGDASRLLNWGFENWELRRLLVADVPIAQRPVVDGRQAQVAIVPHRALWVVVPRGDAVRTVVSLPDKLTAPILPRHRVGFYHVLIPGQPVESRALYPAKPVALKPWWQRSLERLRGLLPFNRREPPKP
ncbi:MAG: D-alanyl-D-alanine carboxypeptidase [Firmicutes bacterium]|nr:D-alanyl-D-alanine carboxypeptidase [Bacillota bacterium]